MYPASLRCLRHLGMLLIDIHEEDYVQGTEEDRV